jgi:hypothetical protein
MLYMVEMTLLETSRRAEWDAWYVAHQHRLLSIPGIHASQRFECMHKAESPFVALHEVDGPQVFTSDAYRASAGPTNTGEWQSKMGNWHRNVLRGLDHTPDVPMDARLVVVEDGTDAAVPNLHWTEAVGLDRSVDRRGFAMMSPMQADALAGKPGIRVLKPLGPRLKPSSPNRAHPAANR